MDSRRLAALLEPFLAGRPDLPPLTATQLDQISIYIDLLLRWNARLNLTAIRHPDHVITRHFGESLFAARNFLPGVASSPPASTNLAGRRTEALVPHFAPRILDLGSGAGFPGLPLKIWSPQARITLIESKHKKVAFLHEVIRSLRLTDIDVFSGRAEDFPAATGSEITLRAVERFDQTLPVAIRLLAPSGRMALLIGQGQVAHAHALAPKIHWSDPLSIPLSTARILLIGVMRQASP
jgi:16S rRNA (guanine527-N7)-methyltransferase